MLAPSTTARPLTRVVFMMISYGDRSQVGGRGDSGGACKRRNAEQQPSSRPAQHESLAVGVDNPGMTTARLVAGIRQSHIETSRGGAGSGLDEADVFVGSAGDPERAEVGEVRVRRHDVGSLVEGK
jgi:hypothetical protein